MSDQDGADTRLLRTIAIADIFEGTEVDYGDEPIETLIMEHDFSQVAFMTETWILKFDLRLFEGVIPRSGDPTLDRYLNLTQRPIPENYYSKHRNCLFKVCPQE